jgi:hypothetical protein
MQSKRNLITPSSFSKPFLPILRRPIYRKPLYNVNSLPNDNEIKSLYEALNNKETEDYKNYIRTTLSQWKPTKKYITTIASLKYLELEKIFTMYRRYVPPLQDFEKPNIRYQLLIGFEKAKTDEERRFYHSILDYYDLIEEF